MTLGQKRDVLETLRRILAVVGESELDKPTRQLVFEVLARARAMWSMKELLGHLGYRKRLARDRDSKERIQRVITALKTNRWGLATAVQTMQIYGQEEWRERQRSLPIATKMEMQGGSAGAFVVIEGKRRGRSRRGRVRKKPLNWKPAPRYTLV